MYEKKVVGILPAAGRGRRLYPYTGAKELFPITFAPCPPSNIVAPKPVIAYSLDLMQAADITEIMIVIGEHKLDIVRFVGDGHDHNTNASYIFQRSAQGMSHAIDLAFPWARDKNICLAMPDTIVQPVTALLTIQSYLQEENCDLVLGIFLTSTPTLQGPVRLSNDKRTVLEILDKPSETDLKNTWGIACWQPSFSAFLHTYLNAHYEEAEIPLGTVFQEAVRENLSVQGVFFDSSDALYYDIGTPTSMQSVWTQLNSLATPRLFQ